LDFINYVRSWKTETERTPMTFALTTVESEGAALACVEIDGRLHPLADAPAEYGLPADLMSLFARWDALQDALGRFAASCRDRAGLDAGRARRLAPLQFPGKVLCAGANYYDHLAEMGVPDLRKEAQRLFFFFKPPRNALVGDQETVPYPADTRMFDWEIELAAVIGRRSRRLTMENAMDAVAAYSVAIDLSARDLNQAPDTFYKLDWVAGKAQDGCCPLGPRLMPARFVSDPQDLRMTLRVNGKTRQDARTGGMVFDIREQLVRLSSIMTLDPGDVLLTGTPAGVGFPSRTFLAPGDRIEAEIESIGTLRVAIGDPA
jgi:2-keto-4-pentenoate hydratase/2-oxohepta-3-ene-1,7-dioic acid hydratase in catechol pathway